MSGFIIEQCSEVSTNVQSTDNTNLFEELLEKLKNSLYSWHDSLTTEIESNKYLTGLDDTNITLKTYRELIVSISIYKELLCEITKTTYTKNIEARYGLFDIYKLIDKLINSDKSMLKSSVMLFSVLLFNNLEVHQRFDVNLSQLSNQVPLIVSMIFYNELQKQIADLNLKPISSNFTFDNFCHTPKRNITEKFSKESQIKIQPSKNFVAGGFDELYFKGKRLDYSDS